MNNVVLIGRLVRDPELRFISGTGTAVTNFTLAVDKNLSREKKQQFESQGKPTADFIRIVVWGKQGENCANYLAKGRLVAVNGSLQTGSYEKNGVRHYTTDVIANRVEFLEWGESQSGNQGSSGSRRSNYGQQDQGYDDFDPSEFSSVDHQDDDIPF